MTTTKCNPDRGWNDPPMFSYDAESKTQKSPRRNQLNKRVAHDLSTQGKNNVTATGAPPTSPPISSPLTGPPVSSPLTGPSVSSPLTGPLVAPPSQPPTLSTATTTCTAKIKEDNATLCVNAKGQYTDESSCLQQDCLTKFRKVLTRCTEFIPVKVSEDINRKLTILSEMWDKDKLSSPVQRKTTELATALSKCECQKAYEIHISLMVDHVSEVNQWMVGIKRLIQEARRLPLECDTSIDGNDKEHDDDATNNDVTAKIKEESSEDNEKSIET
ncbi:steroid receptor RNA activator 1-like isoform X2 [Glandiceps talaboti]